MITIFLSNLDIAILPPYAVSLNGARSQGAVSVAVAAEFIRPVCVLGISTEKIVP